MMGASVPSAVMQHRLHDWRGHGNHRLQEDKKAERRLKWQDR